MGSVRLRSDREAIPSYKAGQRPAPRPDGLVTYKVSSNENPYPPLPSVVAAIQEAAASTHRYPDPFSTRLVEALADRFAVPAEDLVLGTGSVAVLGTVIQAAAHPGDEIVFAWRSFESYPIWTRMAHATAVQVPLLPDERHDLDAMAAAITDRTRVVLVCNPNNPTGQYATTDELARFLDRVPSDIIVVIDEAYREFITDPHVPDGIDLYREHQNVVVLRSFSKAYGLAALRVGFGVAHAPVAEAMRKFSIPFGVSAIAEEAALASLRAEPELLDRVRALAAERERVWSALRDLGYPIHPTQANFVWLRLGDRTAEFAARCEEAGVTVRAFPGDGVRITVAEREANDRIIEVAAAFLS